MRLNPFLYISETDIRFYLLVVLGVVVTVSWTLIFGFTIIDVEFGNFGASIAMNLFLFLLVVFVIPFFIYWSYRRKPQRIWKKFGMKAFGEAKFPEQYGYIQGLYGSIPSSFARPTLTYNLDGEVSAFTFGTGRVRYIGLSAGLVLNEFYENNVGFKSVMLHEIGHVANKDVEKAYLAATVVSSLKIILPLVFAMSLAYALYVRLGSLYYGRILGYDWGYLVSRMQLGLLFSSYGLIGLFLVVFGLILYALRNQIIRLREFYADARVLEWEKSSTDLEKTLEKSGGRQQSKFELLRKFHPSINERILALKDNSRLFVPSLVSAFSIGFLFGFLEVEIPQLSIIFFYEQYVSGNYAVYNAINIIVTVSVFVILMFAVSSSFHKSFLRDVFSGDKRHFSTATAWNMAKFSMIFSFGLISSITFSEIVSTDFFVKSLSMWVDEISADMSAWAFHILYFATALLLLAIFGAMLIKRSFSQKEAFRNFLGISSLASVLYLLNSFVANQLLHIKLLVPIFFLIFAVPTYAFVRMRDKHRRCPICGNQLLVLSKPLLSCPHCQNNLYSWAIYSF